MRHPDRLVAFCSFNPIREHALTEIERCARHPAFKGIKLHFGTSPVHLDNPSHVARTRRVFEAANRLRLPIEVHLAATPEWGDRQARIFLDELVAAAPDVQVVVAPSGAARPTAIRRSRCWRRPWPWGTRGPGTCTST